jgi:putative ABC transport system permease protein
MRSLDTKLLRDLIHMKGQVLAICLVIASGVATLVMSLSMLDSLESTLLRHYERYRFADVFARLKRAPDALSHRIADLPGVSAVQTRVVADVTLDVPGLTEPAVGRLISAPDAPQRTLNDFYLRAGRYLERGQVGEVLAGEPFAQAHGLRPGDSIHAVINGRRQRLTVVGVVLSPEYVFQIREGDLLPDDRHFGVLWMGHEQLAAAYNMEGAFNSVALKLSPGASEPDVLARLDALIEPYGGLGSYGRADQVSHRYVSDELKQLRGSALFTPLVFFAVAAFLLNVVITRLIATQREQVAMLKAFGYSNREIGAHYLKLVLLVALAGVVLGTAAGAWLGRGLANNYARFYRFPALEFTIPPHVVAVATLVALGAAAGGAWGAVRRALKLPPAEAMRPEAPAVYRPLLVERLGLQRVFSAATRMFLRHLERYPARSALSVLGIALATSILLLSSFMEDTINYVVDYQFFTAHRQHMTVSFAEPAAARAAHDLATLPGVRRCEPFRAVGVRLRAGHRSRRVAVLGLTPHEDRQLYRLLDQRLRPVELPPDGLLLSDKLAEVLEVRPGDTLTVEVLEGQRTVRDVVVSDLIREYAGTNAYMPLRALNRLVRDGDVISGAELSVDPAASQRLYATLKNTPRVASVAVKEASLHSFQETMARNIRMVQVFYAVFAGIIAFGVIYNTARISLSERARELASLRVLGFTRREIAFIMLLELATLTAAAIPVGLALGYVFAALLAAFALDTETYRFPLVIHRATYAYAALMTAAAALASALIVRRRIDKLDLVAVLKSRD